MRLLIMKSLVFLLLVSIGVHCLDCYNGGVWYKNGCQCPVYTFGSTCELVTCQNYGIASGGNSDKVCGCPAGRYGKYCESRGCRPAVTSDVSMNKRALIVIVSGNPSMDDDYNYIIEALNETIPRLLAKEPGYIGEYINVKTIAAGEGTGTEYDSSSNLAVMLRKIKGSSMTSPSQDYFSNPLTDAIHGSMQYDYKMGMAPIILAFGDKPDSFPANYTVTNKKSDLLATTFTAIAWRAKTFLFLTETQNQPLDAASLGYQDFKYLSTNIHMPIIVSDKDKLQYAINNVVSHLYKPEYRDVRSFSTCNGQTMDVLNEKNLPVTLLITTDRQQGDKAKNAEVTVFCDVGGAILSKAMDDYWRVYELPADCGKVSLSTTTQLTCSVYQMVNSNDGVLSAYSEDPNVDAGDILVYNEVPLQMTATTSINNVKSLITSYTDSNGKFIVPLTSAEDRGSYTCSYPYVMNITQVETGPFTQFFQVQDNNDVLYRRVYPAFSSHRDTTYVPAKAEIIRDNAISTCEKVNIPDINEPRLGDFKQIIYVLELSNSMKTTLENLLNIITEVVQTINSDQTLRLYSLVLFDSQEVQIPISTYDAVNFINQFTSVVSKAISQDLPEDNEFPTVQAIYQAMNIQLEASAQIHVFSCNKPLTIYPNVNSGILPTNVQINNYLINNKNPLQKLNIMQKQTGGRLMIIESKDVLNLPPVLVGAVYENNMVYDETQKFCDANEPFFFYVEKLASILEINAVGINATTKVTIKDGNDEIVTEMVTFRSKNSFAARIDMKVHPPGQWKVYLSSTAGPCNVQARVISDVDIAIAFSNDITNDFPQKHPSQTRAQAKNLQYMIAGVAKSDDSLMNITVSFIGSDLNAPWTDSDQLISGGPFVYNPAGCTYKFYSGAMLLPLATAMRVFLIGVDPFGYKFERSFTYLMPDTVSCNYRGQTGLSGKCVCDIGYTGEFCESLVCQNGGTSSYGICICPSAFHGRFCEIPIREECDVTCHTTAATTPVTTTTPEPTTRSAYLAQFLFSLLSFVILAF